jgi:hypothetical protein
MSHIVRGRDWQQEMYDTGSGIARKRANQLRKAGFKVVTSQLGNQITDLGVVKTTMITIMNVPYDAEVPKPIAE